MESKHYPLYWYFCCLVCAPFITSYALLITHGSELWILNAVISFVMLCTVLEWKSLAVFCAIGSALGYVAFYLGASSFQELNFLLHDASSGKVVFVFYLYAFIILLLFLLVRDKESAQSKKIKYVELFGNAIAHEVNTPVAAIEMIAATLLDITDEFAQKAKKIQSKSGAKEVRYSLTMPEIEYQMVFELLPRDLLRTSKETRKIIEFLLMLLTQDYSQNNEYYSMHKVINEIIENYLLHDTQKRKRIDFMVGSDFVFYGNKQFLKQIFFNLLNNAFQYAGHHAKVSIWIDGHSIHIKDDGVGIAPENLKNLFKPFHMSGKQGYGVGLAFCSILIQKMGGSIECFSEVDSYTEFVVVIPGREQFDAI